MVDVTHKEIGRIKLCACGWEGGQIYEGLTVNEKNIHGVGFHFWNGRESRLLRWGDKHGV